MDRQTFNTANVPPFDNDECRVIVEQALARGLEDLRCPRDGSQLIVTLGSLDRFAAHCVECHRSALALSAPRRA
ncbi:MAG: hypothetical protein Q8Q14_01395 [Gemmatimonadales bacterium]|nr:hypothetical protein [Gemmatimonadales bacterium]